MLNITPNPAGLGFDADRLSRIDAWMQSYVDQGKFPGASALIARGGEIAYLASVGERNREQHLPFELDSIVRIYSMTKPVASTALMMLIGAGKVHLDATIDQFLPGFSRPRALIAGATSIDQTEPCSVPTIRHLLTHTSGLTYSFNPGLLSEHYAEQKIDFSPGAGGLGAMTERVAGLPLAFEPGSGWLYSVGIDVVGRIIEIISGQTLQAWLAENIFEPLEMVDTAFGVPASKADRFAHCYAFTPSDSLKLIDPAIGSQFGADKVDTFSGGGGLVSTLSDYFRFAEMLRRGGEFNGVRLLSSRSVRFMTQNHLGCDIASMGTPSFAETPMRGTGFGIGGSMVLDASYAGVPGSVGDFGWGGMASTYFWIDPVEALTAIFFTQLVPSSTYPNRAQFKALVHDALVDA